MFFLNSQYKKGVLELCVLALLHKGDCYGYEISSQLAQRMELADGTVYPILRKLKSDGMLDTYLQEESGGPPRKYYRLTQLGRESYAAQKQEYLVFAEVKLRKSAYFGAAREFVDARKQEKLRATASMWLEEHETSLQPRFDVIEIYAPDGMATKQPVIRQLEDAF